MGTLNLLVSQLEFPWRLLVAWENFLLLLLDHCWCLIITWCWMEWAGLPPPPSKSSRDETRGTGKSERKRKSLNVDYRKDNRFFFSKKMFRAAKSWPDCSNDVQTRSVSAASKTDISCFAKRPLCAENERRDFLQPQINNRRKWPVPQTTCSSKENRHHVVITAAENDFLLTIKWRQRRLFQFEIDKIWQRRRCWKKGRIGVTKPGSQIVNRPLASDFCIHYSCL